MLIVELSGDIDKAEERIQALREFLEQHKEKALCQVFAPETLCCQVRQYLRTLLPEQALHFVGTEEACIREAFLRLKETRGVIVSAGSTKIIVEQALKTLGLLHRRARPTIATLWPKASGEFVFVDAGASLDINLRHLVWSALVGRVVARHILGIPQPNVGLLNIGEEQDKGLKALKETRTQLDSLLGRSFWGNVEPHMVFENQIPVEVLVSPGFVGNLILKSAEGVSSVLKGAIRTKIKQSPWLMPLGLVMQIGMKVFWREFDWRKYCGAYLLGFPYPIIAAHGRADKIAFQNALQVANYPETKFLIPAILESPLVQKWFAD